MNADNKDMDVEKNTVSALKRRNLVFEKMCDFFCAASQSGSTRCLPGYVDPVVHVLKKTAGCFQPEKDTEQSGSGDEEWVEQFVNRTLSRAEDDARACKEICRVFDRSTQVLQATAFIDTFHTVMQAAQDRLDLMRALAGVLRVMREGDLDDHENPDNAWETVYEKAITHGNSLPADGLLRTVDELVEKVLLRVYGGDIEHEVAWQVLSDMLLDLCQDTAFETYATNAGSLLKQKPKDLAADAIKNVDLLKQPPSVTR